MYEEEYFLEAVVLIANGLIAFVYTEKFLRGQFEDRRRAILKWVVVFAASHMILSELTMEFSPHDRFFNVVPAFLILFALQKFLFAENLPKQIFVASSFVAGWEILRFTASPLAHAIFGLWSPAWAWALNRAVELSIAPTEKIISVMEITNRAAIFFVIGFCRAVQLGILFLYLRTISRHFRQDYELKFHDALFLIFPCATVLTIDLTLRLMAFSVDNSAFLLIYERVPATILLLPIMSLLLLGIIVASVILFQNLIQYKDEEQKRLLLENRVVEVHREVKELSEIYADIRGLRHDLCNHIENISAYVRKNTAAENSELENYLRQMTDTVDKLDFADRTGNPITDIIIHQARQRAKKNNITFAANFHFPQDGRFDVYDVSVILNNALQNALEACEKISGGKIEIVSYEKGGLYFIEVENNFFGELDFRGELPATTKPEKNLHGVGLANIRRCAQKYLGEIDIDVKNFGGEKIFLLTVMLYRRI